MLRAYVSYARCALASLCAQEYSATIAMAHSPDPRLHVDLGPDRFHMDRICQFTQVDWSLCEHHDCYQSRSVYELVQIIGQTESLRSDGLLQSRDHFGTWTYPNSTRYQNRMIRFRGGVFFCLKNVVY